MQAYQNALEPSVNVLSLVEEIETIKIDENYGPRPLKQVGDIIEYPETDGGSKPYVMWDISKVDIFDRKTDESGLVNVLVNNIVCKISSSMPYGDGNLVL